MEIDQLTISVSPDNSKVVFKPLLAAWLKISVVYG
jgi:hypothetical protein